MQWDWDGRIQRIGPNLRVFKVVLVSASNQSTTLTNNLQRVTSTWKGNTGRGSVLEDLDVTPLFQSWAGLSVCARCTACNRDVIADECSKLFGGIEVSQHCRCSASM